MIQITLNDMVQCAERELRHRLKTYPAVIARGRRSAEEASREIAVREAIYTYLKHDLDIVLGRAAKTVNGAGEGGGNGR